MERYRDHRVPNIWDGDDRIKHTESPRNVTYLQYYPVVLIHYMWCSLLVCLHNKTDCVPLSLLTSYTTLSCLPQILWCPSYLSQCSMASCTAFNFNTFMWSTLSGFARHRKLQWLPMCIPTDARCTCELSVQTLGGNPRSHNTESQHPHQRRRQWVPHVTHWWI